MNTDEHGYRPQGQILAHPLSKVGQSCRLLCRNHPSAVGCCSAAPKLLRLGGAISINATPLRLASDEDIEMGGSERRPTDDFYRASCRSALTFPAASKAM